MMKTLSYEQITNQGNLEASSGWLRLSAIPMGVTMMFVLLFTMRALVNSEFNEVEEAPSILIPDITSNIPKEVQVFEEPLPVKPEVIEEPPKLKVEKVVARIDPGTIQIQTSVPVIPVSTNPGLNMGGQPLPIVRINPIYPAGAAARNIEGYVDVMFDITPIGTTANVRVVGYSPSTVFNSSVVKAVRGWKYKPAADENGTQITLDVVERITFVMNK